MSVHIDSSLLIDALTGTRRSGRMLLRAIDRGERFHLSSMAMFEWLRGRREQQELAVQQTLFPLESTVPFGDAEARIAADLYRGASRAGQREADLAIAACAIANGAALWTLNQADFADIPDLVLYSPR